jgi:hypothetical protein
MAFLVEKTLPLLERRIACLRKLSILSFEF